MATQGHGATQAVGGPMKASGRDKSDAQPDSHAVARRLQSELMALMVSIPVSSAPCCGPCRSCALAGGANL
eukprot:scaffold3273_cov363-Prasinococcus_capsulatus_cf.AAC.4